MSECNSKRSKPMFVYVIRAKWYDIEGYKETDILSIHETEESALRKVASLDRQFKYTKLSHYAAPWEVG